MRRRLLPDFASLAALAVGALIAVGPVRSFDLFYHLASGRWLLAHGFPSADPFSPNANAVRFYHEWSFGILAGWLVRGLGAAGVELFVAVCVAASILLVWRTLGAREERGLFAAALFALVLAAQSMTWDEERPYHFAHVLFPVAILLVQRWRKGATWAAWAMTPLVALWANLHGAWPLAPALLGATAAGRLWDGRAEPAERRAALGGIGAAVVAYLAAALSPAGIHAWTYAYEISTLHSTRSIGEWQPLVLDEGWGRAFAALAVALAFVAGRARSVKVAVLLPAAGLVAAAVLQRRHVPLASMVVAAAAAELWRDARAPLASVQGRFAAAFAAADARLRAWSARAGGALWPFAALALLTARAALHPVPLHDAVDRADYPMAALDALAKLPPGRVLNRYRWGGAVSFFDGPQYPVFIYARNDAFPDSVHDDYEKLVLLEPGWREALDRYAPRYLLWGRVNHGGRLLDALAGAGGWRPVAEDGAGVLWERVEAK